MVHRKTATFTKEPVESPYNSVVSELVMQSAKQHGCTEQINGHMD
jgi:hypothetical protein